MAMDAKLRQRVNELAEELLRDLHRPKGYPAWGTRFVEIDEQTGEVGDALACAMLSQNGRGSGQRSTSGPDSPRIAKFEGGMDVVCRIERLWLHSCSA